jgi:hypothetical protein
MAKNIQILLETMLRCGGNCSGCALASTERMQKADFDFAAFKIKAKKINQLLNNYYKTDSLESITVFLGQGDHFLMNDHEIDNFVAICADIIPHELKHKTVVFITASAIGKEIVIKEKMDMFYASSLKYKIPFFIQTVFDPKKIIVHDNFKKTYVNNILYFKEKCGMTELTINLGEDMFEQMKPQDFHDWVIEYGFKHVEMNWVMSKLTHEMWKTHAVEMFAWLKEWLLIYKTDRRYEINFIPFMNRHLMLKNKNILNSREEIENSLIENLYIDYSGEVIMGQMGVVSNLTPMGERMSKIKSNSVNLNNFVSGTDLFNSLKLNASKMTGKIQKEILKKSACLDCAYKTVCSVSGSVAWFDYNDNKDFISNKDNCPWEIKNFIEFLEANFFDREVENTVFNKNPVQNIELKQNNNEVFDYFIEKLDV